MRRKYFKQNSHANRDPPQLRVLEQWFLSLKLTNYKYNYKINNLEIMIISSTVVTQATYVAELFVDSIQ